MTLSRDQFNALVRLLTPIFPDRDSRRAVLTTAFFGEEGKYSGVSLDGAPKEFTTALVNHLYERSLADLLQLLTAIQEDRGGDLAVALRPYVEVLTQATTPNSIQIEPLLPDPRLGDRCTDGKTGAIMVYVPPGKFIMGSDNDSDDEKPAYEQVIKRGF